MGKNVFSLNVPVETNISWRTTVAVMVVTSAIVINQNRFRLQNKRGPDADPSHNIMRFASINPMMKLVPEQMSVTGVIAAHNRPPGCMPL